MTAGPRGKDPGFGGMRGPGLTRRGLRNDAGESETGPRTTRPVGVLLVDGQTVVRAGLRLLIERYEDLTVLADVPTVAEAVTLDVGPDDVDLPDGRGAHVIAALRRRYARSPVPFGVGRADGSGGGIRASPGGHVPPTRPLVWHSPAQTGRAQAIPPSADGFPPRRRRCSA